MRNQTTLRTSIHSNEQIWLRRYFVERRQELGLSQKALADKMGTIASFIGKVETGDRRLDVFEFISYCHFIDLNPSELIDLIIKQTNDS